jgi:hypothetical protein
MLVAFAAYLAASVVVWWQVWSTHPATVSVCGCGDASLFQWYLAWPAYALAHGHSPFYSNALFFPTGTNLLSNTSVLALGVPLVPVTLIFGPVATFNVASALAPALTGLAMFWLLRRWVHWEPAAFVGGLVYAFSPFVFVNLAGGHLMLSLLALLPLMVGCLDELLVRQRRGPYAPGAALGLLVVVQFFVGTEILFIAATMFVAGLVLLLIYGALAGWREVTCRAGHAARGLGAAAGVAIVLLAYPLWFALAGPAHLSGRIWPTLPAGAGAAKLANVWGLHFQTSLQIGMQRFGGYLGAALPQPEYLGIGILAVAAAGLLLWRRDRRLWFFGALGVVATFLSLGSTVPWRELGRIALVQNVIPGRFMAVTTLCGAVVLGVTLDRTRRSAGGLLREVARRWRGRGARLSVAAVASTLALAVAAIAVVPMATAEGPNIPLATRPVRLPAWFADAAPNLPPGQVVLVYPAPFSLLQAAMTWQAASSLGFAQVGGSGPGGVPSRAGRERPGFEVIQALTFTFTSPPPLTPADVGAVRQALAGWRATTVVVPNPAGLPPYDRPTNPGGALVVFTAAVGRGPVYRHGAWVWANVRHMSAPLAPSPSGLNRCAAMDLAKVPPPAVPDCVLAAARHGR